MFNYTYIIEWDLGAKELSAKKLIDATELQTHTRRSGQRRKSGPVFALYQLIRIRNESCAFVKGNWNEKYAVSAELEQKWFKVIDSQCKE